MKLIVAFTLAWMAAVDAGLVQSYRQGGNFAYAFTTQLHQPDPLMYYPGPIYSENPYGWLGYSDNPFYTHPELPDDDEAFRTGVEDNESKWFLSNPVNTAHAIAGTSDFPVITASASAASLSSGLPASEMSLSQGSISASAVNTLLNGVTVSGGSAPDAIFQYPLLRLFHRIFNRPFSLISRPNRPLSSILGVRPILGDSDTVVINAIR